VFPFLGVMEFVDAEDIEGVNVEVELVSEVVDKVVDVIRLIVVFDISLEIVVDVRVEVLMLSDVMENVGMIIDPEDIEVAFVKVIAVM
jgi:hypothetical protein